MSYILSIDQGTTSSRAILYDSKFKKIASGQKEFKQYFPQNNHVEHDLNEIWESIVFSIQKACSEAKKKDKSFSKKKIQCIGITNQRETFGIWNKKTALPLKKAIVWQDKRSLALCEKLKKTQAGKALEKRSGLLLDPYFSGSKIAYEIKKSKSLEKKLKSGKYCIGTIDSFLCFKLSNKEAFVTDTSNASRTLFMDLKTGKWSADSLKVLNTPIEALAEIKASNALFGHTKNLSFLPDGIPITGILGDQQAALFGQYCFKKSEAKITYGTGAFFLVNTGKKIERKKGCLSTVAWKLNGETTYALESSVFIAGAAVQWLRDGLKIIKESPDVEKLSKKSKNSSVFFIPALSGLGSPHWAPHIQGMIGGITRSTTDADIAQATLKGIAHSVADLLEASTQKLKTIRVDGGASMNKDLMQFQANIFQKSIERPFDIESTSRGAAIMAALGNGMIQDLSSLKKDNSLLFKVKMKKVEATTLRKEWKRRVQSLLKANF